MSFLRHLVPVDVWPEFVHTMQLQRVHLFHLLEQSIAVAHHQPIQPATVHLTSTRLEDGSVAPRLYDFVVTMQQRRGARFQARVKKTGIQPQRKEGAIDGDLGKQKEGRTGILLAFEPV